MNVEFNDDLGGYITALVYTGLAASFVVPWLWKAFLQRAWQEFYYYTFGGEKDERS